MERDPDDDLLDDEELDLFGDPDEVDLSIEEQLDERLADEREDE